MGSAATSSILSVHHGADFTNRAHAPATDRQNTVQLKYSWKQIDSHSNLPARPMRQPASGNFTCWSDEAGAASGFPEQRRFLLFETSIDASTVQAYLETEYRVHGDEPFTFKVGEVCPALAAVHKRHRVDCSAYITAFNLSLIHI